MNKKIKRKLRAHYDEGAPGIQGEPRNRPAAADAPVEYHVDARVMSMIVDSLVEELELLDSYTLVILNPRKNLLGGGRYGYRSGGGGGGGRN